MGADGFHAAADVSLDPWIGKDEKGGHDDIKIMLASGHHEASAMATL